jgi:diacylglycerol O-acyltransferase / wax synthase
VHHALGDGLSVTDGLVRLLTDEAVGTPTGARTAEALHTADVTWAARLSGARERARATGTVVRGIGSLAVQRPAGRSPLVGRSAPAPRRLSVTLDGAEVRRAARAHGVGTTVVVLAALAQALHDELDLPPRTRAMVPLTTRTRAGTGSRADGNRTAAVALDLATGPMAVEERIAAVEKALTRGSRAGQPEGAAAVLTGLGLLPGRLQAPLVRLVYGRRFFHLLASVMPGARRPLHIRGGLIAEVQPVLPLAEGVGLAVGAMHWGRHTCVGITADTSVVPDIGGIPAGFARSLRSMHPGGVHGG